MKLLISLWILVLLTTATFGTEPTANPASPNIVFILSDDQAWTDYGFMGHQQIRTPHIDALAARSAVFRRGYVPTALCRPSLMTLLTGKYPHQHRVTGNDPSPSLADPKSPEYAKLREQLISFTDNQPLLPKLLAEKGYLTFQSGKWWEGNYKRGGFTHGMTRGFPNPGGRHGDDGLKIGREGMEPVFRFFDDATKEGKPFYVWYAPILPHSPHTPPQRLLNRYKSMVSSEHVAKYYAMCEFFDETVGQLVNKVEEKGLAQNTIFVYICDNGWIQSTDGPEYAMRSKQSPYEGGVRQPILIRWDGVIEPKEYDDLTSSIDLVPTLLSSAGIAIPKELPGLDLLSLVRDKKPLERDSVFGEGFAHDVANLQDPEETLLYRWTIQGKWKLILTYDGVVGRHASSHPRTERRPQLFDLLSDPHETKNLAANHSEVVARLAKKIDAWWPVTKRKTIKEWSENP